MQITISLNGAKREFDVPPYYTLLRLYDGAPEVRRVILDNIRMGERVAAHVAVLKAKVFGKDGEHGPVRTAGLRADSPALS